MERKSKPGFNVPSKVDRYDQNHREKSVELTKRYLEVRHEWLLHMSEYVTEIQVPINSDVRSFVMIHLGDTHLGHDASDFEAIQKSVDNVLAYDALLVLHGNIIESVSNKFLHTNTTKVSLDLDQQVRLANAFLKPALEKGVVIAFGKNFCHEGWTEKTSTHDVLPNIVDPTTPLLYQGGEIILVDSKTNKEIGVIMGWHNGGKGDTQQSPEGSARARSRAFPDSHDASPDLTQTAHKHQSVAAQEIHHNPILGQDIIKVYGQVAAAKGHKDYPDTFLGGIGAVGPHMQPGDVDQGNFTIFRRSKPSEKFTPYPVVGEKRMEKLYSAIKLWEAAQGKRVIDDLKQEILAKTQRPTKKYRPKESTLRTREEAAKSEGEAPIYKILSLGIDTNLPIMVSFMANLRLGSTSFRREELVAMLKDIENNPWAYFLATRRLVNQGVPQRHDRQSILADLGDTLAIAKSSLLTTMLTDDLRNKAWGRAVKFNGSKRAADEMDLIDGEELEEEEPPKISDVLYPGDWLYYDSPLKKTPLIFNEAALKMKVGSTNFTLYCRDELANLTSLINVFHGLGRVQELWGLDADVLIGGHTEIVGWRTWMKPWGQLEIVVPGGFSEYVEKGLGNRTDYPLGGQGVILVPGEEKMIYSYASHRDGLDMHEALFLQEGLKENGTLYTAKNKLKLTKR